MPILLCPHCGKNDLVPLAHCEFFIEGLPHLNPSGCGTFIVATVCKTCSATVGTSRRPPDTQFNVGSNVETTQPIPELLIDPESGGTLPAGSTGTVTEVVRCEDGEVYVIRFASGIETCAVADWLRKG